MRMHLCVVAVAIAGLFGCGVEPEPPSTDVAPQVEFVQGEREIIRGHEAYPNHFPWQARITLNGGHWCGGSLIHRKWVLTAAHCLIGYPASSFGVVLGDHQISVAEATEQHRAVRRYLMHPGYNPSTYQNDIALIELSAPVELTPAVYAIRLDDGSIGLANTRVAGWGMTEAGTYPDTLRWASIGIVDNSYCNNSPNFFRDLYSTEICAGSPGWTDSCFGDSGGPLTNSHTYPVLQAGIVSWGPPGSCGNDYGVYTRVSSYVPWITNYTGSLALKQVRIRWGGNLSHGEIKLHCLGTGEVVRGTTIVDGIEVSLDCPNSTVVASVSVSGRRWISDFDRTVNGAYTYLNGDYSTQVSDTLYVGAGDTVQYQVHITD